jgi:hypothetical protein
MCGWHIDHGIAFQFLILFREISGQDADLLSLHKSNYLQD